MYLGQNDLGGNHTLLNPKTVQSIALTLQSQQPHRLGQLLLIAFSCLLILSVFGCSNPNNANKIPARATGVLKLDLGSVAWKSVSWSDLWNQIKKSDDIKAKDSTTALFSEIGEAGLSLTQPIYIYAMPTGLTDATMAVLSVNLSSASEFKVYLDKQKWVTTKPKSTDGMWSANAGKEVDIVWNDEVALIALKSGTNLADYTSQLRDQIKTPEKESLKGTSIIFKQTDDDEADVSYYVNTAVIKGIGSDNDEIYGHISLEDGKFGVKGAQVGKSGRLTNQGLWSAKTKSSLLAGCPIEKPSLVMTMAIEPDTLLAILTQNAQAPALQSFNKTLQIGYETNMGELLQLWDGQVGVMGYIPAQADGWLLSSQLAIRLGVRDQMLLSEILNRLVAKELLVSSSPNVFSLSVLPVKITQLEDHVTIAYNVGNQVENGKVSQGPWSKMIDGHTLAMWVDPAPLVALIGQFSRNNDSIQKHNPLTEINMITDLEASSGRMNYNMEFMMKEKKVNAARSLLLFMSYTSFNKARSGQSSPEEDPDTENEPASEGLPSSGGPKVKALEDNG